MKFEREGSRVTPVSRTRAQLPARKNICISSWNAPRVRTFHRCIIGQLRLPFPMNQLTKIQWQYSVIDDVVRGVHARFIAAIVTHRGEVSRHVLLWTMVSFLSATDESLPWFPLVRVQPSFPATTENPRFSMALPTPLRINHHQSKKSHLRSRSDAKNCSPPPYPVLVPLSFPFRSRLYFAGSPRWKDKVLMLQTVGTWSVTRMLYL